ncbi:MAG TPA: D-2-hydroxyacid dehydrogenase [Dehalococcoidia bacterium]
MPEGRVSVLVEFDLAPELLDRIRAVDPRVEVSVLGREHRRALRAGPEADPAVREEALRLLSRAEVLFARWFGLPREAMEACRSLRWLQVTSAGVDRILESGTLPPGVTLTNVSGLHAVPIGEYILGAMLMFAKGAHRFLRAQARHEWVRFMPTVLAGKTAGIVGMGAIGRAAARYARAFDMHVLGIRRSAAAPAADDPDAHELLPLSALHDLLRRSDFVVLAVPLTRETRRLIGEAELRAMKPTACLINIARGAVVDEAALVRALREGWIGGAVLDVFEQEPLPPDSPLWDLENAILSPHVSGGVDDYDARATAIFVDNLGRYVAGQPLRNVVDPERGY